MLKEGDLTVEDYTASSWQSDQEFVVDYIIAERRTGVDQKKRRGWEYIVKWQASLVSRQRAKL